MSSRKGGAKKGGGSVAERLGKMEIAVDRSNAGLGSVSFQLRSLNTIFEFMFVLT